ncbi:MAG: hypothetical protein H6741_12470 [Alphaproteobacteria bacterium]|nr:hypothetical protein [Alphaproteobacteria bacterium]
MKPTRSALAAAEIARMNTFFPLMPALGMRWARRRPWEGMRLAVNAHLTTLTAALLRELSLGGGTWTVCASSPATTDLAVVDLLREDGFSVHTGGDLTDQRENTLREEPELIADVGFELLGTLLTRLPERAESVRAAVEITRTGVNRLRKHALPFPVVNLNDGRLKANLENRHGVGGGLWSSVTDITGMQLAGRRVLVIGYGPVGQGVAFYARAQGGVVDVVDRDPLKQLIAHYDGFLSPSLEEGLARAEVAVTATGTAKALGLEELRGARDGLVLVNAGHGGEEIDIRAVAEVAEKGDQLGPLCVRYKLPEGPWLTVLGKGHPLNIVTNSGSPEPVLLQFALIGLSLEWLAQATPPRGEQPVPPAIEAEVARYALKALRQG